MPKKQSTYDKRKAAGLCVQCGKTARSNRVYCEKCDQIRSNRSAAWRQNNLERAKHIALAAYYRDPEKAIKRAIHRYREKVYGLTQDQYNQMLDNQGGVCLICKGKTKSGKSLSVDHDHIIGAVRGLLCDGCNRGLGYFRDSPELLEKAAEYLRRYR